MSRSPAEFVAFRKRMNERILAVEHKASRRFFALDKTLYAEPSALPEPTKELLGLVASLVLRCDDCVSYHLSRCREVGLSFAQIYDAMVVGLVVGGSIVIPHLRRAVDFLDQLEAQAQAEQSPAPQNQGQNATVG